MTKNYEPPMQPVAKRRSATQEGLEARRTGDYPPASPHRVGHTPGLHGEDAPYMSQEIMRPGLRTIKGNGYMNGTAPTRQRPSIEDEDEETHAYAEYPKRGKTTQRVYTPVKATKRLERTRFHWLVFVGLGLFIMIIGWLSFSALSSWWSTKLNNWTYGNPRTYQTDFVVGHGDSAQHPSHFIALNLNGHPGLRYLGETRVKQKYTSRLPYLEGGKT